jgi:hypothetical protein
VVRAERDLPTPRRWFGLSLDGGMKGDFGRPESLRLLALAWVAWEATLGSVTRGPERTRTNLFGCVSVDCGGFSATRSRTWLARHLGVGWGSYLTRGWRVTSVVQRSRLVDHFGG